jgi:riboflavin kinase/FMN adenylyltransferase
MQILTSSDILNNNLKGSIVTIGNFDGVHRGHLEIFRRLTIEGRRLGLPTVAVTFDPHPLTLLSPENAPQLITTFEQKAALIADAGIDYLAVISFTAEFAKTDADSFVREILCSTLRMRYIIIGHDYAFGRGRQGNYQTLAQLGAELHFSLEDIDPVANGDIIFSSSLARRLINSGDMYAAANILGRYHLISGKVVHGRDFGRKIGFPTANITTDNELIPPDGVYAVFVVIEEEIIRGACSIGKNATFGTFDRSIEAFLLDFSKEIYDRYISFYFVKRLRESRKFPDLTALIEAIAQDVVQCREILADADRNMVKCLVFNEKNVSNF